MKIRRECLREVFKYYRGKSMGWDLVVPLKKIRPSGLRRVWQLDCPSNHRLRLQWTEWATFSLSSNLNVGSGFGCLSIFSHVRKRYGNRHERACFSRRASVIWDLRDSKAGLRRSRQLTRYFWKSFTRIHTSFTFTSSKTSAACFWCSIYAHHTSIPCNVSGDCKTYPFFA